MCNETKNQTQTESNSNCDKTETKKISKTMMLRELIRFIKSCLNYKSSSKYIDSSDNGQLINHYSVNK